MLATSLQEIMPHADRDHFVYVFNRIDNGHRVGDGIQVEEMQALGPKNEFQVDLSENGVAVSHVRIRATDKAIKLLGEDDLVRGIGLTYDPPLTYLEVPLYAGRHVASTTAKVTRLDDATPLGTLRVQQVVDASAGPPLRSQLGTFPWTVWLRIVRTLHDRGTNVRLSTVMLLAPGVGELHSFGAVSGKPSLQRQLACATIRGRHIGNCHDLRARWKEMNHAGSSDLH